MTWFIHQYRSHNTVCHQARNQSIYKNVTHSLALVALWQTGAESVDDSSKRADSAPEGGDGAVFPQDGRTFNSRFKMNE